MHNGCLGQIFTFKASAPRELAGVPATVVTVWPRFRSGDYLVTLEFVQAVKYGNELLTQIDGLASELEPISPKPTMHPAHRSRVKAKPRQR